jgi:Arc/MetJ family transcription regulator
MRTTLNIDDELLEKAKRLSGAATKTEAIERGLEALVAQESARRLARLAGRHPEIELVRRRRPPATR